MPATITGAALVRPTAVKNNGQETGQNGGKMKIRFVFILCLAILIGMATVCNSFAKEDRVRARIGIRIDSKGNTVRAKAQHVLPKGAEYRVYVNPEKMGYVYVVHADGSGARLLNMTLQKITDGILCLPSEKKKYNAGDQMFAITIVYSPIRIATLSDMIDKELSCKKWAAIEKDLTENSKIVLTNQDEKAFEIAGNVRKLEKTDPFVKDLPVFSGKSILIKKYAFQIEK